MANKSPVPFESLQFTLPAGQEIPIPGTFTWLEILTEYTTGSPTAFQDVLEVRFYPDQNATPLPPGITVILDPAFPSSGARIKNTSGGSITFNIAFGAGKIPARDNRLSITGGTNIPVTIISPLPLPVILPAGPQLVTELTVLGTTGIDTAITAVLNAGGVANPNGIVVKAGTAISSTNQDGVLTAGGIPILGCDTGAATVSICAVLPKDVLIPAGADLTFTRGGLGGAAQIRGSFTVL